MQTVYTKVVIKPCAAGFGEWERGELQVSPSGSFALLADLLQVLHQNLDGVLPLAEALTDAEFVAAGVQDIRGLVRNQPGRIYAALSDGEVRYIGVEESEVADDFYR